MHKLYKWLSDIGFSMRYYVKIQLDFVNITMLICNLFMLCVKIAKSDSFCKIRFPDFLCNEFLIKMYRLSQNYNFEIYNL